MSDSELKFLKKRAAWLTPAPITYNARSDVFCVFQDWTITFAGMTVTIPAGTASDLASIPRFLWWMMAPHELTIEAAIIHDVLYSHLGVIPPSWVAEGEYRTFTRAESDAVLSEMADRFGAVDWRRRVAYGGVRAGGWPVWRMYQRATT